MFESKAHEIVRHIKRIVEKLEGFKSCSRFNTIITIRDSLLDMSHHIYLMARWTKDVLVRLILWCILNKLQLNRFCKVYNLILIENNWLESRHVSRHMLRLTWAISDCCMLHFRFRVWFRNNVPVISLLAYTRSIRLQRKFITPSNFVSNLETRRNKGKCYRVKRCLTTVFIQSNDIMFIIL